MSRRFVSLAIAASALLLAVVAPRLANACSFDVPQRLQIVDEEPEEDPPEAPDVVVEEIVRGTGPETDGCGVMATSCDDIGRVRFAIEDADPELGYEFAVSGGELPEDFRLPNEPVHTDGDTVLMTWIDGSTDEQEPIAFSVDVAAVDKWGQRSDWHGPVDVADPGRSGAVCSLIGHRGDATWWLLLLAAAGMFGLRRRKARAA